MRRIAKGVTKKVTKGTERGIARRRAGEVRGPAKDGGNLRGRRKS
ncbi:hypothetical protein [Ignatzschineria indica]|nr:hypothetical protein [Ignatzschineria indica]